MKTFCTIFLLLKLLGLAVNTHAQIQVHASDFEVSQGDAFTVSGNIGSSPWAVSRSGHDWGARIHEGVLELTNTASDQENENGWVFAHLSTDDFHSPYQPILGNNIQKVSWYFTMRQIRSNPAGFGASSYGVAFILAATSEDIQESGSGYAVVLGNSGTPDPVRLVKFENGISSLGTTDAGLVVAGEPLDNPTNNYMSIGVTFNPSTSVWELWGRLDEDAFADPLADELTLLGTANDNAFTGIPMGFSGAYWQGSFGADQTAFFDNITIWVEEGGSIPPMISNVVRDPEGEVDNETSVMVSADVVPGDAPLETVNLIWGIETDFPDQIIPMSLSSGNTWTSNTPIPAQPDNTLVSYAVSAQDEDDLASLSAIFSYTVTGELPTFTITGVIHPQPLSVDFDTSFEDLPLPQSVMVNLDFDTEQFLQVTWEEGDYNPQQPGDYTLYGTLQHGEEILNPNELQPEILVTVLEEVFSPDDIIVGWTFPQEDVLAADLGVAGNVGNPITREDNFAGAFSFPAGVSSLSLSSTSWNQGQDEKYYEIEFSTIGYEDLTVNSAQRSSNTGPRDFKLQYSIASGDWQDVPDADIVVANNFSSGVLAEFPLPQEVNQQASVSLRWIMNSNTAVNGSDVASTGTSRIDDIIIRGIDADFVPNVISVQQFATITVEQGTTFTELPLPEMATVQLNNGESLTVEVQWQEGDYDSNVLGSYTLAGELMLPEQITNDEDIQAVVQVHVVQEIVIVSIVSVHVIDIVLQVDEGTPFDQIPLPASVEVTLSDDTMISLEVTWSEAGYNPDIPGVYIIEGELVLISGIENPDNLQPEIMVEVTGMLLPETIAGWIFSTETLEAEVGIPSNIGKPITRDASFTGNYSWPTGAEANSKSVSSTSWADGVATKYWMIEVSTIGYADLILSGKQRSSNTGPRDFRVQYRIGADGQWMDVPNSEVTVANDFTTGILDEIPLPAAANNKAFLFIRWVMESNTSVNEEEVAASGTSRIDEILISGYFSSEFKRIVTSIESPQPLQVDVGTPFENLPLSETVRVLFDDGGSEHLPVQWTAGNYNAEVEGTYILQGSVTLSENMENPDDISAEMEVVVAPPVKIFTVTFNIDMTTAPNFDPGVDQVLISGSMFNFAIPGTLPNEQTMTPAESNIWSITMELEEGSYVYRYYINAGLANPEPGPDRTVIVDTDMVLNDMWGATSVEKLNFQTVNLYPNPVSDVVFVSSEHVMDIVQVYDMKGKLIRYFEPDNNTLHFSIEHLDKGVYLVRIVSGQSAQIRKLVVDK